MNNPQAMSALLRSMIVCPDYQRNYPRISHGSGAYVFDEAGKAYLDASSGSAGVSNLGHGIPEVVDVVAEQMSKIAVMPTHTFSNEVLEHYLLDLTGFAPKGFNKAWLVGSGTEAVENALKVALQYHQLRGNPSRHIIISRWGSYHGNSIFALDVGGMQVRRNSYAPWLNNFPHIPPAYAYRHQGSLTAAEYACHASAELEEAIEREGPENIAAFISEPIVAAALGAVPAPADYFKHIRAICDRHGILLIADEVLCGFGRTGATFGMEHYGVSADIIAAGKGISGGYYPLSAILLQEKVSAVFEAAQVPFLGGHTFSCNPVGAAVGAWALNYIHREDIIPRARNMGILFREKLGRLYRHGIVGDIRGEGMMMGLELVADRKTKAPFPPEMKASAWIARKAFEKGVVVYPGRGSVDGIAGDHIMLTPPLIITEDDMDLLVQVLDESILEFQNAHVHSFYLH
jgi:adenosylmethionine-8-amino-7-oxononanoate aminotransferase